jgi:hypothetical protein
VALSSSQTKRVNRYVSVKSGSKWLGQAYALTLIDKSARQVIPNASRMYIPGMRAIAQSLRLLKQEATSERGCTISLQLVTSSTTTGSISLFSVPPDEKY